MLGMQGMQAMLLLVALAAGEVVNPPPVGFSMERERNHSTPAAATQEGTKIESWSPNQPELTQMFSYPRMPSPQPFVPANYYLSGNARPSRPSRLLSPHPLYQHAYRRILKFSLIPRSPSILLHESTTFPSHYFLSYDPLIKRAHASRPFRGQRFHARYH
jgi:hypothetical protein